MRRKPTDARKGFAVPAGLSSPGRKSVRVTSTRSSARLRPTRLPWTAQWSSYGTRPPSATRFFAHVATFRRVPVEWPPMRVFIVSDMEGVAGISNWQQVAGGESLYEEGRKLYTQEINAAVRGARAGGATEVVVMDCHGAGEGLVVQLAHPRGPRRGVRVRRPEGVDRVHRHPRGRVRRGALHRHARHGRDERRVHDPHRLGDRVAQRAVQRHRGRRDRHQRRAVRHLGLPGAARDRRPGGVPRGSRAARRRAHHRPGEDRLGPVQRPAQDAGRGAPDDRGGSPGGARRHEGRAALRPGEAVRGPGRARDARPHGAVPPPPARRDHRRPHDRLARRRLVDGVAAVLLQLPVARAR